MVRITKEELQKEIDGRVEQIRQRGKFMNFDALIIDGLLTKFAKDNEDHHNLLDYFYERLEEIGIQNVTRSL